MKMASSSASGTVSSRVCVSQNRPTTSLSSKNAPGKTYLRKQRSLGDLVGQLDGPNELLEARARLKPVAEVKKGSSKEEKHEIEKPEPKPAAVIRRRRTNSSVLEELDDLLDTAIGEHITQFTSTESRETNDNNTPDWPLPREKPFHSTSPSKYVSRHSSTASRRRQSRQRQQRVHSSNATESNTSTHAPDPSVGSIELRNSIETNPSHHHSFIPEAEHEPVRTQFPGRMQNNKSPIKQRTALFEKLSQHEAAMVHEIPHVHDARDPIKIKSLWPPKQNNNGKDKARFEFVPSLQRHHRKFHHDPEEAFPKRIPDSPPKVSSPNKPKQTHVPPIQLTLPQLISPRRQSQPDVLSSRNSFTTAPETKYNSISLPSSSAANSEDKNRITETLDNWPLKRDIFRKSPNALSKTSKVIAQAEPYHHTSAKKTHDNQHRVRDLLVAAQAVREPMPEPESVQQGGQESTPPHNTTPRACADTLQESSASEKEVVSHFTATSTGAVTPGTPRGRQRPQDLEVIAPLPTGEKRDTYKSEQRFALSRSRSRGGGVRVQVEIRSPHTSPERGGEHTFIVTANVEAINEADEVSDGAD